MRRDPASGKFERQAANEVFEGLRGKRIALPIKEESSLPRWSHEEGPMLFKVLFEQRDEVAWYRAADVLLAFDLIPCEVDLPVLRIRIELAFRFHPIWLGQVVVGVDGRLEDVCAALRRPETELADHPLTVDKRRH